METNGKNCGPYTTQEKIQDVVGGNTEEEGLNLT